MVVDEESVRRNRGNSWWKRRTKLERRLISILIISTLLIIGLAVGTAVAASSKSQSICLTDECVKQAAILLYRMNTTIQPCDDFYQFVCGRYIKESQIPDDKTSLDPLGLIGDLVTVQVKTVIMEPSTPNDIKPITMLKKMYKKCMNTSAIEENSLEEIKSIINDLGGWPILEEGHWFEQDWINITHKLRQRGFSTDHFISIDIDTNSKNSSEYIISIDQAKNEEISESNLQDGLEDDLVKSYSEYLIDLVVMFGAEREFATKEIHAVIEFRAKIAQLLVSKAEHYQLLIMANDSTIAELQEDYPSIPWVDFINVALNIPNKVITVQDRITLVTPKYIGKFEELIKQTPSRVQVNHALLEVIRSSIEFLPEGMRKREREFMASATGATESRPRWDICINKATHYFNFAADLLYIRKYANEEAKKDVTEMVALIKDVFVNILKNIEWMDSGTKIKAIEKANMISAHIAYPKELNDVKNVEEYYSGVKFESDSILELVSEMSKFKRDKSVSFYGRPVIKNHWTTRVAAITSNAFYDPQENSIQIPAGIMQNEFYTKDRPHYMNYGGLGLVIGHEITHGFDSDGKWFDKFGNVLKWWEKSTDDAFTSRAQCFVDQYSNYTVPEVNLNLNGENTLAENIADNGGIKEAYLAYLEWTNKNQKELPLPGLDYSAKQLFWISLTNAWCTKSRKFAIEQSVLSDEHSPDRYRILGALSNLQSFSEDFNCPLGSKMNPRSKCQIW